MTTRRSLRGSEEDTLPDQRRGDAVTAARRERRFRRVAVAVMAAFIAAGLVGAFGSRDARQTATRDGLRYELTHPSISRGGLPARWILTVQTDGAAAALPSVIEVRTTSDYVEIFDHHNLVPEPDATWQDDMLSWEFRPEPADDALRIELDVRIQPDARWRHSATTEVLVDGVVVASFDYSTFVVP